METSIQGNQVSCKRSLTFSRFRRFFYLCHNKGIIVLSISFLESFFQGILMDHNNKSLSSAVKLWAHFLRKRKNEIVRCKGLLNIMRFTKAGYSCSFPAMTRLQGNRKCQSLKLKFYMRTFSFEVPRIHSQLPGDLAGTTTHLQWK